MSDEAIARDVDASWPRWARDIHQSLTVSPQFALWGNVRDMFLVPGGSARQHFTPLLDVIHEVLQLSGYQVLLVYDLVHGLQVHGAEPEATAGASELLGREVGEDPVPVSLQGLPQVMESVVNSDEFRAALVVDYAARLTDEPERLPDAQREFFAFAEKLSHRAPVAPSHPRRQGAVYNPVFWVLDREADAPDWFVGPNDSVRTISVPRPQYRDRLLAAGQLVPALGGNETAVDLERATTEFAAATHGLTLANMREIVRLARDRELTADRIVDAVRAFKVGVLDSPWRHAELRARIVAEEPTLRREILGQEAAITRAMDTVKRAAMGLSGAQVARHSGRPRGVLFLAGPTGVGKTELAKQLTSLVFGGQEAYVRFDMSEFSAEHADARLIGAPPGYVGYGEGGELTNAVRQQPFSLVLFDEIDKASDRILDKFLQILEDGRLTDGRGDTVHFSETILVFTSNLGIFVEDETGKRVPNVNPDTPYEEVVERVTTEIRLFFERKLNRPELLNRLGDNIVVFDFIRPDVAVQIFDLLLENITDRVRDELGIELSLSPPARTALASACTADRWFGARGIGSQLEARLVNPLARALFERDPTADTRVEVVGVLERDGFFEVKLP